MSLSSRRKESHFLMIKHLSYYAHNICQSVDWLVLTVKEGTCKFHSRARALCYLWMLNWCCAGQRIIIERWFFAFHLTCARFSIPVFCGCAWILVLLLIKGGYGVRPNIWYAAAALWHETLYPNCVRLTVIFW